MNIKEIKAIIDLLKDTDISEIQIEEEGIKLKLRREKFFSPFKIVEKKAEEASCGLSKIEERGRNITVVSPIVGTFYRASSPDADPFVEKSSRVKKGQVLCVIDAMKLMNEIESEVDGKVIEILIENGQSVEYGEPLFLIAPD